MLTGTAAGVDADLAANSTAHRHPDPDAGVFLEMGASKLMLIISVVREDEVGGFRGSACSCLLQR
jgi:hypothetical protein